MIHIRQAVIDDLTELVRIENESFPDPWSEQDIAGDISGNDVAYVAVMIPDESGPDCRPEGYADMWMIAGEAQLMNIAIGRNFRGRGYGRKLLEHMTDIARECGCTLMTLEVRRSNAAAISLYTSIGFTAAGIRPAYYIDNNEDAILMDLALSEDHRIIES
jgi:ribosomal-protein-alanine N-acetyltransferase